MANGLNSGRTISTPESFVGQGPAAGSTESLGDILLIEDDDELAGQTQRALTSARFLVRRAATLADASKLIQQNSPDVLILDRMLPDGEGLVYLQKLKESGFSGVTLISSALGETHDRIRGLDHGADDYLPKPFDMDELIARVCALLRRSKVVQAGSNQALLQVADLSMDLLNRTVTRAGAGIKLQPREFKLLEFLTRNAGEVVTRMMLLKHVWGLEFDPQTNVVEVHISRLRAKLDRDHSLKLLHTVRGNGYSLRP